MEPMHRGEAVRAVCNAVINRMDYVVGIPFEIALAAQALDGIECVYYLDNGTEIVMVTDEPESLSAVSAISSLMGGVLSAVAVVPKTVSVSDLAIALRHEIADDKDLILLGDGRHFPALFAEATNPTHRILTRIASVLETLVVTDGQTITDALAARMN